MDKLVMNEDSTVNEFLDWLLDNKKELERDVVGTIKGISISTEGCTTRLQLQNKLAGAMKDYISGEKNENPTKRQQDEMTIMLDESIVPKADWDNPKDVLAWIEESTKNLNDPEFARTVYRDGKTPAEVMVEMLKTNGYGEMRENQSEDVRLINAKISDLENYGFLASELFGGAEVNLSQSQSMNNEPPAAVMETFTGEVEPISFGGEETQEDRFLSQNTSEFEDSLQPPITAQPDPSMFTANSTESESEIIRKQLEEAESQNSMNEMKQSSELTEDDKETEFFSVKRKDEENDVPEPSFQTRTKDDTEDEFFRTKPKDDPLENEEDDDDFLQVKPKDEDLAELEAFQAKYGPTANVKEMKIVKRIEKELVELAERRKEIKEELTAIHAELKNPSKVVPGSVGIANIENKNNSDLAIHEAREKIRLSTAATRNNDAVVAFNKAVETHSVIDIIRTSNAIEALGNEHLLSGTLTHALEEMSKTYYDETIDQLKEDLMEGSKALTEANQLLATNPDENIYEDEIAPVRDALKNIATDRSKEKIMYAVIQVGNLKEDNPYTPTIMNALDKISNLYYGKSAEEIKNQILDSSKACNEARNEIQLSIKRQRELYGDLDTYEEQETGNTLDVENDLPQNTDVLNKFSEEEYRRAYLRWRNETTEAIPLSIRTMVMLEDGLMVPLGRKIDTMRHVYEAMKNGVHYEDERDLTQEQISWWTSQGINLSQEKQKDADKNPLVTSATVNQLENVEKALNAAVMTHSKENILEAATLAQRLNPKEPSRVAINKALNQLAVTHLNKNLTELRWQDAKVAIEEAQKSTNTNAQEAMQRFNQATKTYTKADIIVALNMAKEAECPELVSALNKMAIAYYGVDAEALTTQFRNYSKALNEVQNLISSNEIPQDAKENEAMPLFHKAVQSKSEEDIMNALDAANNLPSYHPLKKPMIDALNAQLVTVTREEPMTFEEPVVVNDNKNKKELQKKATALLQEYQKVDSDIKKRQNDLGQYAKNKQKEKEKLQEPPAKIINETTNTNPNLFKKACAYAKYALKNMTLKKVATAVVTAAVLGVVVTYAPMLLIAGVGCYQLFKNPENAKKKKEENNQKKEEWLNKLRDEFLLKDDEDLSNSEENPELAPLEQEEPVQQSAPAEQQIALAPSEEEIEFYKAEENEWVKLNDAEELVQEVVDGSIIGASIHQGPIQEYSNEEIMNYLHNGTLERLEHSEEEKENENQHNNVR